MDLLWYQFSLQISHFVLTLFASLVLFGVCWLYFDAWLVRKGTVQGILAVGFFFISVSYLLEATVIEQGVLAHASPISLMLITALRSMGYLSVLWSLARSPLLPRPTYKNSAVVMGIGQSIPCINVLLAVAIALQYRHKAYKGLEYHLLPLARGFLLLSASELLSVRSFWQASTIVWLTKLTGPFGLLWISEHIFLFLASLVFLSWVWSYLLKRFETQLFFIFTAGAAVIFFVVTTVFSSLFVTSMEHSFIEGSQTLGKLLSYSVSEVEKTNLAQTAQLAKEQSVVESLSQGKKPSEIVMQEILTKFPSFASFGMLTTDGSTVLNSDTSSPQMSDSFLQKVRERKAATTIVIESQGTVPQLAIVSLVAVSEKETLKGFVWTKTLLDTAFLDGVNKTTGLASALYAGNVLAATTLSDNVTVRQTGILLTDKRISQTVLIQAKPYTGLVTFSGKTYLGSFMPILSADATSVGMVFIGQGASYAFATIGKTISFVFQAVVILIGLSVIPSLIIARSLAKQAR